MSQKEIELILTRQLAMHLAMPVFIVNPAGSLIYYNEHAERVLGMRFDETGELAASEWSRAFRPAWTNGQPVDTVDLPLMVALRERRPAHARFMIQGLDSVARQIEVTAIPLIGQGERCLGAAAFFWEAGT